jgi:hypothetical protein
MLWKDLIVPEMVALESLWNRGCVHVVGRTAYRTARATDHFLKCDRSAFRFLEDRIQNKDNHCVVIFQVLYGDNGWPRGTYYAFLTDSYCLIGKGIEYKEF